MPPRALTHLLGLCNLVAGALLAFGPWLVAPLDGIDMPAARLLGRSGAALLWAIALGAWSMPAAAATPYLWLFGVLVKVAAAALWGATAVATGVPLLWGAAAIDLAVAAAVAAGLRRPVTPPGSVGRVPGG